MPDGLYERDFYSWTQDQAERLKQLAERTRDNGIDWPNLIEEVESLGRSDLLGVKSLLRNVLAHLLKIAAEPDHPAVDHWSAEITAFQSDAAMKFSPGMRQHLEADLQGVYAAACRQAARALRRPRGAFPDASPIALGALLDTEFDLDAAIASVRSALPPRQ
jgi:hypothetical protein